MADLRTYKKKRNFRKTPEPRGSIREASAEPAGPPHYMIHKHDARRLHYDLRLEMDGALASWAIPKGPSLDPSEKRLAVQTEDHPLAYGSFEGRIPEGEYGAGDSLIWDKGVYDTLPPGQASAQRQKGHLSLVFFGEKLRGHYHLIRTRGPGARADKASWLFFKAKDEDARTDTDLTAERPESVVSGRKRTRGPEGPKKLGGPHPAPRALVAQIGSPMLARLATAVPQPATDWVFELKYDGFRALAGLSAGQPPVLLSRKGQDLTGRFASVAASLRKLVVGEAVLDGEVVALDPKGVPRFQLLQGGKTALVYFAFDLLWLDGQDLRGEPLETRRDLLASLLANAPPDVQISLRVDADPVRWLAQAASKGFEGLVAKRRSSLYRSTRSGDWLKLKVRHEQELAVVGYQPSTAAPRQVGSLLLAYANRGQLVFAGKVGTGFTAKMRADLFRRLAAARAAGPTAQGGPRAKGFVWVEPTLVAQVAFSDWTSDGLVRQAAFLGLRDDKAPLETGRD